LQFIKVNAFLTFGVVKLAVQIKLIHIA